MAKHADSFDFCDIAQVSRRLLSRIQVPEFAWWPWSSARTTADGFTG